MFVWFNGFLCIMAQLLVFGSQNGHYTQNVLLNTDAEKSQIYVVYAKNQKSYFAKIDFLVPNHLRYDHQVSLFSEKMDFI